MSSEAAPSGWSLADAERHLLSLELFGMRFGLDRMRRLLTVLGNPQSRYDTVHVVGTNGKSSTTRMIASLLAHEGLRAGAYTSPHLLSYAERVQIDGHDLAPDAFAAAVAAAARAADMVNRTLTEPGDRVTQFELLTAAAYHALAEAGIEVAVIEAGLGGRYDATNVIDSRVQVLTNVGLEHTRWLGPTVEDIAREKLDVVTPGGTLVVGADLEVMDQARALAAERGARLVVAEPADAPPDLRARGGYQRRNFAVAISAARAFLGREPSPEAVRGAAAEVVVPGRFEVLDGDPPVLLDVAHNASGIEALAASLDDFRAGRPLTAVVAVLDDKDAAGMLALLAPHCARFVLTATSNPRTLTPATLASLARQLEIEAPATVEPDPHCALARAREHGGPVLVTGSVYLIADLLRGPTAARGSML